MSSGYVKDECVSLSYSRPDNNAEWLWCLCFWSRGVRGRVKACYACFFSSPFFFCFFRCTVQNCTDKHTLPCKVKTQHLQCVLKYWFSLAAIGRRSKEDGAMCAGPRVLGEIQAALCTPREWGLAYIECLCCRIESVEHLCLSSLPVKLGLTKNPSYTNRKWSSPSPSPTLPPPRLCCVNPFFSTWFCEIYFYVYRSKVCFTWKYMVNIDIKGRKRRENGW